MPAQPEKHGRTALWLLFVLLAGTIGFVLGGFALYQYGYRQPTTTPSGAVEPNGTQDNVTALGHIEPEDGVISLSVLTPARIARINVKEGETVEKDKELVILDSAVMRELELELAKIQHEQAEKRLNAITASGEAQIRVDEVHRDQVEKVEPLEIKAQDSKVTFLLAQVDHARKDNERYIAAGDTIAEQDKEKQRLVLHQLEAELLAAQCQRDKLLKGRELNRSLAKAQLEASQAELRRNQSAISLKLLKKQVAEADERLKETQVRAPSAGKILRILVHPGELVGVQPVLQMANTEQMIVLAEVYVTSIDRVEIGQKATITSHIFKEPDVLTGEVVWKGSSIGKPRVVDMDPRAAVDQRVVEVKIKLDQSARVAQLIGHQVQVRIAMPGTPKR